MDEKRTLAQQFIYVSAMLQRLGSFTRHGFPHGVNPQRGQGRVLAILKLQPEITQKELGYLLDMRNQSLGELLNKLEKRGFIVRSKSETDRRTTNIRLTPEGKAAAEKSEEHGDEWEELFDSLTPQEKEQLYSLLDKLGDGLLKKAEEQMPGRHRGFGRDGHRSFDGRGLEEFGWGRGEGGFPPPPHHHGPGEHEK